MKYSIPMSKFDKLLKQISDFQFSISIVALVAIIGINALEIVVRFFTGRSFLWIQDVTLLLMVWVIFLGFTKIVYDKGNVTFNLLIDLLAGKVNVILTTLTNLLILIFYLLLSKYSYQLIVSQYGHFSTIMKIPLPFYSLAVFINCLSVILIYANEVYKNIIKVKIM
jgi:TRAP-type C4-dicarboxylate transport system permease small subunit